MTENINNQDFLAQEDSGSSLNIRDIWEMVWVYKWWYVLCVAVCLVFAAFYLYKTPSVYQRTAKVIISEDGQDAAMRDLAAFASAATGGSASENVNNEVEAFASPDLMQIVVERLRLQTSYVERQAMRKVELYDNTPVELTVLEGIPQSSFSFSLKKGPKEILVLDDFTVGPDKIKADRVVGHTGDTLQTPVGKLMLSSTVNFDSWERPLTVTWVNSKSRAKSYCTKLTSAVSGKQTSVIVLGIEDVFPSRAENILNTLIDVYNETWIHDRNRSARNTTAFINERLVVIEKELGGIETSLKDFKEKNKLTDIQLASQAYLQESTGYSAQAFEVSNQLSIAQFIRSYMTDPTHSKDLIPANSGLVNTDIESQIKDYNDMLLTRDRLVAGSSENNPLIQDMNTSLNALKATVIRSIDNLIATLSLQADKLTSQEEQVMSRIASSSGTEMELLSIERQQKVKESLYIYLLQKREENEIAGLVNVANTRLIMSPNGAPAPISPNRMMVLLVAVIFGCGIPFAVQFIMRMSETTISRRADLSAVNVPFLGEIPLITPRIKGLNRLTKAKKFDNSNVNIMVRSGSRDSINEAFRVMRTNLDMMTDKKSSSHILMTTSVNPNAGKTFILMNIAASMALKGAKTIMVDLDLRKATLSKALNMNSTGVSSYLSGRSEDYHGLVKKVDENLSLLPVGSIPPNPSELLISPRFAELISGLKKEYEYIFIDCPPVEMVADTYIVSGHVDMTLFVIRAGLFDKRELPLLSQMNSSGKLNRMSLILNGVETFHSRYGQYGYGYGYGYGEGNDR